MYRHPDELIAACEQFVPLMIDWAVSTINRTGVPLVSMSLHKGADGIGVESSSPHHGR